MWPIILCTHIFVESTAHERKKTHCHHRQWNTRLWLCVFIVETCLRSNDFVNSTINALRCKQNSSRFCSIHTHKIGALATSFSINGRGSEMLMDRMLLTGNAFYFASSPSPRMAINIQCELRHSFFSITKWKSNGWYEILGIFRIYRWWHTRWAAVKMWLLHKLTVWFHWIYYIAFSKSSTSFDFLSSMLWALSNRYKRAFESIKQPEVQRFDIQMLTFGC